MLNDTVHFLHEATHSSLREIRVLCSSMKPTQGGQENEETKKCITNKNKIKTQKMSLMKWR